MMRMVLLAVLSNIMVAYWETNAVSTFPDKVPAATYLNVAYGADPKQVMDIYLPEGRNATSTRVMFMIHGGSWSGGDKHDFHAYVDSMQTHLPGYAIININYRLATYTLNKFPAQEEDIKSALTFVIDKSEAYNISKEVVLLGASAGAHLALLQAYKYTDPVKAKAVVSFFGPTDIADMYNNPVHPQVPLLLQLLMSGSPASNPAMYNQSSPVNFVTPETCPTLLFQGGKDPLVNPRQANLLKKKLESAGVASELVIYPDEGHGWRGQNLGDSFAKISRFLAEQLP